MIKEWKFDWNTFLMKRKIAIYEWGDFGGQDTYMPMLNISFMQQFFEIHPTRKER